MAKAKAKTKTKVLAVARVSVKPPVVFEHQPGGERVFTREDAERIAALLQANKRLTLLAACIDAGMGDHYHAIRKAANRARKGPSPGDKNGHADMNRIGPIVRAIEKQCEEIVEDAESLARTGKSTNMHIWWAEVKNPAEYGRKNRTEITGEDGGPVQIKKTLQHKSDDEIIALMLAAKNIIDPADDEE